MMRLCSVQWCVVWFSAVGSVVGAFLVGDSARYGIAGLR